MNEKIIAIITVVVFLFVGLFGMNMSVDLIGPENLTGNYNTTYNSLVAATPFIYDVFLIILIVACGLAVLLHLKNLEKPSSGMV